MKKKLLALLLAASFAVSNVNTFVFAEEVPDPAGDTEETIQNEKGTKESEENSSEVGEEEKAEETISNDSLGESGQVTESGNIDDEVKLTDINESMNEDNGTTNDVTSETSFSEDVFIQEDDLDEKRIESNTDEFGMVREDIPVDTSFYSDKYKAAYEYTVTFDYQNGNDSDEIRLNYGEVLTYNDDFTNCPMIYNIDESFVCWNTSPDGSGLSYTTEEILEIPFNKDITLYAIYDFDNICTIRFIDEENNKIDILKVKKGKEINYGWLSDPESPNEHKKFREFNSEKDGSGESYEEWTTIAQSDMTYYAVYEDAAILTLDYNGGLVIATGLDSEWEETSRAYSVFLDESCNSYIYEPYRPDDEQMLFSCWNTSPDGSGESYSTINVKYSLILKEDITLYAIYETEKHLTLNYNGGYYEDYSGEKTYSKVFTGLSNTAYFAVDEPKWQDDSKGFYGWNTKKDGSGIDYTTRELRYYHLSDDLTVYAVFKDYKSITLDYNGGYRLVFENGKTVKKYSSTIMNKSGNYNSVDEPEWVDDTCGFYTWNTKADGTGRSYSSSELKTLIVFENITLYAIYNEKIKIVINYNGGSDQNTGETLKTYSIVKGSNYTINVSQLQPVWKDSTKVFYGFSTKADGSGEYISRYGGNEIVPTGDTTYYVLYREPLQITLDFNGGNDFGDTFFVLDGYKGESLNGWIPTPQWPDDSKGFYIWNTKPDGTGESYTYDELKNYTPTKNVTFYAIYRDFCTLTFYCNKPGKNYRYTVQTVKDAPFNEYYSIDSDGFFGWNTKADGSGEQYTVEELRQYIVSKDTVFYAVYKESVRLTFNTGEYSYFHNVEGNETNIQIINWSKGRKIGDIDKFRDANNLHIYFLNDDLFEFDNWNTEPDGTGEAYSWDELSDYTVTGDITFYAQCKPEKMKQIDVDTDYQFTDRQVFSYIPEHTGDYVYTVQYSKYSSLTISLYDERYNEKERYYDLSNTVRLEKNKLYYFVVSDHGRSGSLYKFKLSSNDMPISPSSYTITPANIEIPTCTTMQINISVNPANADNSTAWTSSNEKVATVDENGVVTAKTYGTTTITATSISNPTVKASCTIQTRFNDVDDSSKSYYKPVYWGADKGIVAGFNGGEYFGPDENCTRAQFVTFLWRLAGKPTGAKNVTFNDITGSENYFRAIKWAVSQGIIVGFKDDNTFRPDESVTRSQVAVMLWRYAGKPAVNTSGASPFTDINSSNSAFRAVKWGQNAGVIKGTKLSSGNYSFNPDDDCLRQHIVTFLFRYAREILKWKV